MSASRISELAKVIAEKTAIVDDYLTTNGLPALSFDSQGPKKPPIPAHEIEIIAAQDEVIASTQELHDLMKGPDEMLMGLSVSAHQFAWSRILTRTFRSSIQTMC